MGDICKHNLDCTQGSALEPSADSSASGSVISWPGGWPECNEGYVFKDKVRGKVGAGKHYEQLMGISVVPENHV